MKTVSISINAAVPDSAHAVNLQSVIVYPTCNRSVLEERVYYPSNFGVWFKKKKHLYYTDIQG